MKTFCVVLLAVVVPAVAIAQERVYTLSVTHSELSAIATALAERPYKEVNPVITSIARQVQAQDAAAEAKKKQDEKSKTEGNSDHTKGSQP